MIHKLRKRLTPVIIFLFMAFIFSMSAQPAGESTEASSPFCDALARLLVTNFEDLPLEAREALTEGLAFAVRKTAHFLEYALLGGLWYFWLYPRRHAPGISWLASSGYAALDEVHQLFVPGRSGEVRDWLIDTAGALCGIVLVFVLFCVWQVLKERCQENPKA